MSNYSSDNEFQENNIDDFKNYIIEDECKDQSKLNSLNKQFYSSITFIKTQIRECLLQKCWAKANSLFKDLKKNPNIEALYLGQPSTLAKHEVKEIQEIFRLMIRNAPDVNSSIKIYYELVAEAPKKICTFNCSNQCLFIILEKLNKSDTSPLNLARGTKLLEVALDRGFGRNLVIGKRNFNKDQLLRKCDQILIYANCSINEKGELQMNR